MSKNKNSRGILFPPLVGYSFSSLIHILKTNSIAPKYYVKVLAIVLINLINLPFRIYERLFINPRFENKSLQQPPIFIIGHWRSGTTHLHNLLSQDSQMAFVSTYQSVFPNTLFNIIGRFIFRNFMGLLIPKNREGDNVTLGPELPQEEEFTLGHRIPFSYYLFWFFPKKSAIFFEQCIKMKDVDKKDLSRWKKEMRLLIHKALYNTKGTVFLSKNPPNTGRIPLLLEMFPDAKFIHIHRNPIDVYLSTQNFFNKMMPHLQLEDITKEEINRTIVEGYKNIMHDYLKHRNLISKNNLIEVSFDQLEKEPLNILKSIYKELNVEGFNIAEDSFKTYINKMSHYKKNTLSIEKMELETILEEWKFAMDEFNYKIPDHVKLKNDA